MKMRFILVFAAALLAQFVRGGQPVVPSFYARQDYVGLFTQYVLAGDTNGDGIPDLIAMSEGSTTVLFGNGDGTFRPGPLGSTGAPGNLDVVAVDLNGDGRLDLVVSSDNGNFTTGGVYVSFGNGDGTFQSGTFYPEGSDSGYNIGALSIADFNGDGILDIAQVGASGVWLFTGNGNGLFNAGVVALPLPIGAYGLAQADFNRDGKADLVVGMTFDGPSGKGDGFYVSLGNGNGTFQTPTHFSTPNSPFVVKAGGLGPNGYPSIAMSLTYSNNDAAVYLGDGSGNFSGPQYLDLPTAFGENGLGIADVNGDGIGDLVSASYSAYVALGTASGTFDKAVEYPVQGGMGIYNLALADLRNDGRTDIVTDSQSAVSVLLNTGKGSFEDGLWTKLGVAAGCGVTGDFNSDGKPDLAVNTATGISILLGTTKAASPFTVGTSITLAGAGCLTQARDINNDGILDLVITTPTGVNAYLGKGDGTFTLKSSTLTSTASFYVALGDFNHDGNLDFATAGNLLALGNGDGTFQTPKPIVASAPAFDNITVGDINNDGWPDIVLTNYDQPYMNLYVLLDNHKGGFTQIPQTFGALSTGAVLADLNGDGFLDLVCTDNVYLGDGKGDFTFVTAIGFGNAGGGTFNMVADVNGDGIPDIAVLGSGTVQIYLGEGKATYAAPIYLGTGPSPSYILPADLHGQKAKVGLPDLVAPDSSGGVMVLLNTTE